jgi:hypothetical protein
MKRFIPCLLKKRVFLASKTLLPTTGIRNFILFNQIRTLWSHKSLRNEHVNFSGYVDIQVSYKILWLEVLIKAFIFNNPPCFQ